MALWDNDPVIGAGNNKQNLWDNDPILQSSIPVKPNYLTPPLEQPQASFIPETDFSFGDKPMFVTDGAMATTSWAEEANKIQSQMNAGETVDYAGRPLVERLGFAQSMIPEEVSYSQKPTVLDRVETFSESLASGAVNTLGSMVQGVETTSIDDDLTKLSRLKQIDPNRNWLLPVPTSGKNITNLLDGGIGFVTSAQDLQKQKNDLIKKLSTKDSLNSYFGVSSFIKDLAPNTSNNNPHTKTFLNEDVPTGLGSATAFIGTTLGANKLTKGKLGNVGNFGMIAGMGSMAQKANEFESALNSNASLEDAIKAGDIGAIVGLSEAMPLARILNRLDKTSGGSLKKTLRKMMSEGSEEAAQESFQTIMSNLIASDFVGYEPNRKMFYHVQDGAEVGFTTGTIISFLASMVSGRRGKKLGNEMQNAVDNTKVDAQALNQNAVDMLNPNPNAVDVEQGTPAPVNNDNQVVDEIYGSFDKVDVGATVGTDDFGNPLNTDDFGNEVPYHQDANIRSQQMNRNTGMDNVEWIISDSPDMEYDAYYDEMNSILERELGFKANDFLSPREQSIANIERLNSVQGENQALAQRAKNGLIKTLQKQNNSNAGTEGQVAPSSPVEDTTVDDLFADGATYEDTTQTKIPVSKLAVLTVADLKQVVVDKGVQVGEKATKAELIDAIDDNQNNRVVEPVEPVKPKIKLNKPVTRFVMGKINPNSAVGASLKSAGITPRTIPGLFKIPRTQLEMQTSGVDGIPVSELHELGIYPPNWEGETSPNPDDYADPEWIVAQIISEYTGIDATLGVEDQLAMDEYDRSSDNYQKDKVAYDNKTKPIEEINAEFNEVVKAEQGLGDVTEAEVQEYFNEIEGVTDVNTRQEGQTGQDGQAEALGEQAGDSAGQDTATSSNTQDEQNQEPGQYLDPAPVEDQPGTVDGEEIGLDKFIAKPRSEAVTLEELAREFKTVKAFIEGLDNRDFSYFKKGELDKHGYVKTILARNFIDEQRYLHKEFPKEFRKAIDELGVVWSKKDKSWVRPPKDIDAYYKGKEKLKKVSKEELKSVWKEGQKSIKAMNDPAPELAIEYTTKAGKPFKTKEILEKRLKKEGLTDSYDVVNKDSGFVGVRRSEDTKSEDTAPVAPEQGKYKDTEKYHQTINEVKTIGNLDSLKKTEFGQIVNNPESYDLTKPIEVSLFADGELKVTDGHHRLEAAKQLGVDTLPVNLTTINAKGKDINNLIKQQSEVGPAETSKRVPIVAGATYKTESGRETTPYPKGKKLQDSSQWLIDNAIKEAEAKGDRFNATGFKAMDATNFSQSDSAGANLYLFGDTEGAIGNRKVSNPIKTTTSGKPFKNEATAKRSKFWKDTNNPELVEMDGGFGISEKNEVTAVADADVKQVPKQEILRPLVNEEIKPETKAEEITSFKDLSKGDTVVTYHATPSSEIKGGKFEIRDATHGGESFPRGIHSAPQIKNSYLDLDSGEFGSNIFKLETRIGGDIFDIGNPDPKLVLRLQQSVSLKYKDKPQHHIDYLNQKIANGTIPPELGADFLLVNGIDTIRDGSERLISLNLDNIKVIEKVNISSKEAQTEVVAEIKPETKDETAKIQDFGEKIGGARKDTYTKFTKLDADIDMIKVPLSKSFPKPNYKKLIEEGVDPVAVVYVAMLRNEIPTKPRKSWALSRWVKQAELARDTAMKAFEMQDFASANRTMLANNKIHEVVRPYAEVFNLADKVDSDKVLGLVDYRFNGKTHFSKFNDKDDVWKYEIKDVTRKDGFGGMGSSKYFDTKQEALDWIIDQVNNSDIGQSGKRKTKFTVYRDRITDAIYIGKKIGTGKVIRLAYFDTSKEAFKHIDENYDQLVEQLAKEKDFDSVRNAENNPRVGEDYRQGKPVTAELFTETFGFRGVEFGNWVEGSKRQEDLDNAYDGLVDLANLIGVPTQAMSLNGELGLAFGARGTRGAKAHYEAGSVVINLTKKSGAGSLAHEWWHAMDNYFAKMEGKDASQFMTEFSPRRKKIRDGKGIRSTKDSDFGVRKEVFDAFQKVQKAITKEINLLERARRADQTRGKDYWSTTLEMTARSFERYVIDKLGSQGYSSDYLANVVSPEAWKINNETLEKYQYPLDEEMEAVNNAYDNLFKIIKTKQTDKGVAMFSTKTKQSIKRNENTDNDQRFTQEQKDDIKHLKLALARAFRKPVKDVQISQGRLDMSQAEQTNLETLFNKRITPVKTSEDLNRFNGVVIGNRPNTIFVNEDSEQQHISVIGHEMLHEMRKDNPELFEQLVKSLRSVVDNKGFSRYKSQLDADMDDQGMDRLDADGMIEEFVADLVGDNWNSEMFWKKVAVENMSTYKKIVRWINTWIAKLLDRAGKLPRQHGIRRSSMRASQFVSDLVKAQDMLAKVMRQYIKAKKGDKTALDGLNDGAVKFMTAFHGSPYDHNKFETSKVGTGEGAHVYGWGLYFAESKDVAEWYKKKLSRKTDSMSLDEKFDLIQVDGKPIRDRFSSDLENDKEFLQYIKNNKLNKALDRAHERVDSWIELSKDPEYPYKDYAKKAIKAWQKLIPFIKNNKLSYKTFGRVYEVELAPKESEYLLWDMPLSKETDYIEQSDKVLGALKIVVDDFYQLGWDRVSKIAWGKDIYHALEDSFSEGDRKAMKIAQEVLGYDVYSDEFGAIQADQLASEYLHTLGIRGVKYLDGSSRSSGKGDYNYVIFDESDVSITAKFSAKSTKRGKASKEVESAGTQEGLTKLDTAIEYLQNMNHYFKGYEKALTGKSTVYEKLQTQNTGVIEANEMLIEDFEQQFDDHLKANKLTLKSFDNYMKAKAIADRLIMMNERTKGKQGNSYAGWSEAKAKKFLSTLSSNELKGLKQVEGWYRNIIKRNQELKVAYGIELKENIEMYNKREPNYVSWKEYDNIEERSFYYNAYGDLASGLGREKRKAKSALGRNSESGSVVANLLTETSDLLKSIAQRNIEGSILNMLNSFPESSKDFEVTRANYKTSIDKKTGIVSVKYTIALDKDDMVIYDDKNLNDKGKPTRTLVKPKTEVARRIIQQLRSEHALVNHVPYISRYIRFLSAMATMFNPEFALLTNPVRDTWTVMYQMMQYPEFKNMSNARAKVAKRLPKAWKDIAKYQWGKDHTGDFKLLRSLGGKTGWSVVSSDYEQTSKHLEARLKTLGRSAYNPRKIAKLTLDQVVKANEVMENGIRVAIFRTLVDENIKKFAGKKIIVSELTKKERAELDRFAFISKNVSLDFNMKGNASGLIKSMYMFSNPAIQGAERTIEAMKHKEVRNTIYTLFGLLTANAMMQMAMMGDDDDDGENDFNNLPAWQRNTTINFMIAEDKMLSVPFALNMAWLNTLANTTAKYSLALMDEDDEFKLNINGDAVYDDTINFVGSLFHSLSPVNPVSADNPLDELVPTVLQVPMVALKDNKNFFGGTIYKEDKYSKHPDPAPYNYKKSTDPWAVATAQFLHHLSGGDESKTGKGVLANIHPESLEYIFDQQIGSAGAFVRRLIHLPSKINSGEVRTTDIPFYRRLVKDTTDYSLSDRFREAIDLSIRSKDDNRELWMKAKMYEKMVTKYWKGYGNLKKAGKDAEAKKFIDTIVKKQRDFLKIYNAK